MPTHYLLLIYFRRRNRSDLLPTGKSAVLSGNDAARRKWPQQSAFIFGGGVPFVGRSIVQATGIALGGLFYPMAVAALGIIVSILGIREPTHEVKIRGEVGGAPPVVPDQP
jgi:hypothetical protein